jgi:hypothetical protein
MVGGVGLEEWENVADMFFTDWRAKKEEESEEENSASQILLNYFCNVHRAARFLCTFVVVGGYVGSQASRCSRV